MVLLIALALMHFMPSKRPTESINEAVDVADVIDAKNYAIVLTVSMNQFGLHTLVRTQQLHSGHR